MNKLVSNQFNLNSVPGSFIQPPEGRPGSCFIPPSDTIPVIDLSGENNQGRANIVQEIIKASQEFGFFQVINHDIPESLMNNMMGVAQEFFNMPAEDRASLYSEDPKQIVRVSTSVDFATENDYDKEKIHYWRDSLRHPCFPLEKFAPLWPSKPTKYREIAESYAREVRKLGMRLMELIGEGMGINAGYFHDTFNTDQLMVINHYPLCPDPSLTMGLPKHCDPNTMTILQQGEVAGLQVMYNDEWITVQPVRNAFVVNLGHQLPVICNGKLRSAEHRAVTNSGAARTSIGTFLQPAQDDIVQPAPQLIDKSNPQKFKAFTFHEFLQTFLALTGESEKVLEHFKF